VTPNGSPTYTLTAPAAALTQGIESANSASGYTVPTGFLWLVDLVVLGVALVAAHWLAPQFQQRLVTSAQPWVDLLSLPAPTTESVLGSLRDIVGIGATMVPGTLLAIHLLGGYRPVLEQSRTRLMMVCLLAPTLGLSVVTLGLFTVKNSVTPRSLIFSTALLTSAGLLTSRGLIRRYKGRRLLAGHYARNVVIIAPPAVRRGLAAHFAAWVSPNAHRWYGHLDPPGAEDLSAPGRLGTVSELADLLIRRPIHEVLAVHATGQEQWLTRIIEQCEYFQITLRLVPEALLKLPPCDLQLLFPSQLNLPEVVLRPRSFRDSALFAKRVFDIVGSLTLLVVTFPLLLLIAIAIKLTTPKLPVLYPWRVVGYKGRTFTGYKFTTMVADAEQRQAKLMHLNEMSGPVFKIQRDPRITPLGRLLRKFSLNELPQLWSVLRGDMSLVGPRPAYPDELNRYELWHKRKLCVQPGITCLWQVRGRNRISSFDDWVRMDFEYIDNWSLWLDCRILVRTAWAVLAGTGS
jgi:exopolysaccharide biosynthesis polyprenyl glycosylphosphotransferase